MGKCIIRYKPQVKTLNPITHKVKWSGFRHHHSFGLKKLAQKFINLEVKKNYPGAKTRIIKVRIC